MQFLRGHNNWQGWTCMGVEVESPFGWSHAGIPQHQGSSRNFNPPPPPPSLITVIKNYFYASKVIKVYKCTSESLIMTKWHKYLMGIEETLLPEKQISIRPLSVLWFLISMLCPVVTFRTQIGLNRRETCQFKCFIASFNIFKVLQGSFQYEYWHMVTFPTGKCRLLLYYPGRTFHFPRATGKRNSRPLYHQVSNTGKYVSTARNDVSATKCRLFQLK